MLEGLRYLFSSRPLVDILRDLADVVIVAYMCYRGLLVLRGTRAMQMGVGLVAFGLLYLVARYAELVTLLHVLSWIATSLILIVVVVFQNDIRRALIRVGSKAWLARSREQESRVIDEVVEAATELARHRIGAIITFERDANLLEFVRNDGIQMDSLVSRELLVSLFLPESLNKTHDGAVLIRDLRIARAGMFFPMPESKVVDSSFGSRHRAAIGITEETDAVVVVVSEERGTITLCFQGSYVGNLDGTNLRAILHDQLGHRPRKEKGLMRRIGAGLRGSRASDADSSEREAPASGPPASASDAVGSTGAERTRSTAPPPSARPPASSAIPKSAPSSAPTSPVKPTSGSPPTSKATAAGVTGGGKKTSEATGKGEADASESGTAAATAAPTAVRGVSKPMATPAPAVSSVDTDVVEATLTPAPSRVSKPMPVARERRTLADVSVDPEITSKPSESSSSDDESSGALGGDDAERGCAAGSGPGTARDEADDSSEDGAPSPSGRLPSAEDSDDDDDATDESAPSSNAMPAVERIELVRGGGEA